MVTTFQTAVAEHTHPELKCNLNRYLNPYADGADLYCSAKPDGLIGNLKKLVPRDTATVNLLWCESI